MANLATITNFEEYFATMQRISDVDLANEYIDLKNMLDSDCTNGYAVEIMDGFMEIVLCEIAERFVKTASEGDEESQQEDRKVCTRKVS